MQHPPNTLMDMLRNVKLALEHNLLIKSEFYSNEELRQILGGTQVNRIYQTDSGIVSVVSGFDRLAKPFEANGPTDKWILCSAGWNTESGQISGQIHLTFTESASSLSFEHMVAAFGPGWKVIPAPNVVRPPELLPVRPRTNEHGYEQIRYVLDTTAIRRSITLWFLQDGLLGQAIFSEEMK